MAKTKCKRVTMSNAAGTATDLVPVAILDVYVADARTRWESVEVGEDVDYEGDVVVPAHLEGMTPEDFAEFGDHATPDNALDRALNKEN